MGIQRKKSLEELKVQAIKNDSDYLWQRYLVALDGKKAKEEKQNKMQFEDILRKETNKYGHLE